MQKEARSERKRERDLWCSETCDIMLVARLGEISPGYTHADLVLQNFIFGRVEISKSTKSQI